MEIREDSVLIDLQKQQKTNFSLGLEANSE